MRKTQIIIGTLLFTILLVLGACAPAPAPAPKEVELKYDDGTAESAYSAFGYFRVHFSPPATPFTINKIKIFTLLQGSGYEEQKVEVAIVSKDFSLLYSYRKAATEFSQVPSWTTIEIPDVTVDSDFYAYLYPNSKREGGVWLGYDLSTTNQHSEHMMPSGEVASWTFPFPKEKTNWMIRVVGTYMAP